MIIKQNDGMKNLLKQRDVSSILSHGLNKDLAELLTAGIHHEGSYFVFNHNLPLCKVEPKDFPDLTGFECFVNKVSLDEFFEDIILEDLVCTGLLFVRALEKILKSFNEKFKIILSVQVDEFASASVRFHAVRANEAWIGEDLNKYSDECILVVETEKS